MSPADLEGRSLSGLKRSEMPPTIQILSESLCNQIAAGEVVERPLSVVKELVENSLDAGATVIRIVVEKGGRSLIRVEDNGAGMSREDLFLCLERHATSKITTADDLFHLTTLGFRGEAIPSIAAVSRMRLASRTAGGTEGFELHVEGGKVRNAAAAGIPPGTVMEVRNLFFNTPARKKFLKSETTEFGHIADFVSKIALSFPQVQISLENNRRPVINLFRHHSLADRVIGLLGKEVFRLLVPFEKFAADGMQVSGFLGLPDLQRKSASGIHSFVNRRFVRDRLFQHAVMEGYRNLLPRNQFPVVILFLEIEPDLVDVNVHPTKREVRFSRQGLVHDFIADSIQAVLRNQKPQKEEPSILAGSRFSPSEKATPPLETAGRRPEMAPQYRHNRSVGATEEETLIVSEASSRSFRTPVPDKERATEVFPFDADGCDIKLSGYFSALEVLGQFHNSYIVCRSREELVLIDQHAAHERIGFERLKAQFHQGRIEVQELLFPKTLEFGFQEAAVLEENLEAFLGFGFGLEPYGGKTFILRSVPAILDPGRAEQVLKEIMVDLSERRKSRSLAQEVEKTLITMACHSMIRANQALSAAEMKNLLRELDSIDFSSHCPHGRPAVVRFSLRDVEKLFHRP